MRRAALRSYKENTSIVFGNQVTLTGPEELYCTNKSFDIINSTMKPQDRILLLKQVIDFDGDLDVLIERLSTYAWDFDDVPAFIDKTVIESVLSRYIAGSLNVTQLYKWADFLELRDDVGYLEGDQEFLSEVIHTLANPDLEGTFTTNKAKEVLSKL